MFGISTYSFLFYVFPQFVSFSPYFFVGCAFLIVLKIIHCKCKWKVLIIAKKFLSNFLFFNYPLTIINQSSLNLFIVSMTNLNAKSSDAVDIISILLIIVFFLIMFILFPVLLYMTSVKKKYENWLALFLSGLRKSRFKVIFFNIWFTFLRFVLSLLIVCFHNSIGTRFSILIWTLLIMA